MQETERERDAKIICEHGVKKMTKRKSSGI